ncbi:TetR/AcrR family transcriptional regulator [Undibacterium sp. TJN25]|uniref:TetR/AcrR family transcriptional regulator n=1 Tax=Undibacterium sp. TJN25 TaxID=3413056 RepID=UPI003BF13031
MSNPDISATAFTQRGHQRREALVAATLQIIVRDGPAAVSLRAVAKEAGASHGLVVYYFGTRSALMTAALDNVCNYLATAFENCIPALEAAAGKPEAFAAVFIRYNMEHIIEHPEVGLALHELNIAGIRDEALRPILHKWGKVFTDLCRKAFRELGSQQPEIDYGFLLNAIGGIIIGQFALPRKDFEKKIFTPAVERLVRSIAGGSASQDMSARKERLPKRQA